MHTATYLTDLMENANIAHAMAPDTASEMNLPVSPASDASSTSRLPGVSADQYSPYISITSTATNTTPIVNHASSISQYLSSIPQRLL
jgi:hypothetical protein